MALIVQKYGGTSVADLQRIRNVAERVIKLYNAGNDVAVVLSAMAGETNRLVALGKEAAIGNIPYGREMDVLMATGEQITVSLLAIMLNAMGYPARSFLGHQAKISTSSDACQAFIVNIDADPIKKLLDKKFIPIIAGFQGADYDGNITTLGRGGSDTTAVAIAAALSADVCEILTDVDGVYTTNPTDCPRAQKIRKISYDDMLEMASLGSKVLHKRSVELAKKYNLPIHLRTSFSMEEGTMVMDEKIIKDEMEVGMESPLVTGITNKPNQVQIIFKGVPNIPGVAAKIFYPFLEAGISVDMISQSLGEVVGNITTDVSFTIDEDKFQTAESILQKTKESMLEAEIVILRGLAKVSAVGSGMDERAGAAWLMFKILGDNNINMRMVSTSEIKISVLVEQELAQKAVQALHTAFGLDAVEKE